jgi:hypothetical protein
MKIRAVCLFIVLIASFAYAWATDLEKIVVVNPRGIQPEIRKIPMATRPATLDGKTFFVVDSKYPNTKPFVESAISFSREIHESIL